MGMMGTLVGKSAALGAWLLLLACCCRASSPGGGRPAAGGVLEGTAFVDGRYAIGTTDDDFVCATLDWWPPEKCDYGWCSWGRASLLNLVSSLLLLESIRVNLCLCAGQEMRTITSTTLWISWRCGTRLSETSGIQFSRVSLHFINLCLLLSADCAPRGKGLRPKSPMAAINWLHLFSLPLPSLLSFLPDVSASMR